MPYVATYPETEPSRAEVDAWPGLVALEFGADWCPICQAAQPTLRQLLEAQPAIRHVKIADGKGRPLGRSFQVRLWPNLVLLNEGKVVRQLARPDDDEMRSALTDFVKS